MKEYTIIFNGSLEKWVVSDKMMTFNELVDEALNSGADIQGNGALGFFMFPNKKYNRSMCYNLIERLDAFAKKEGKILNIKIKEVKNDKLN